MIKEGGYKMEYADAIRILKEERELYESDYCTPGDGTPDGTLLAAIDEAIEGLEKQIPKKPVGKYTSYKCPVCGRRVRSGKGSSSRGIDHYCQKCGQAIDWEETE